MGKWGRWFVLTTVVVILLLIVGVIYMMNIAGNEKRLGEKLAEIRAKDEPVCAADLMNPKIPDDENAAILYTSIFKEISGKTSTQDFNVMTTYNGTKDLVSSKPSVDEIRSLARKYSHVLIEAKQAATKPKCRFPVNWEEGLCVLTPHYMAVTRTATLARTNGLLAMHDGNADKAIEMILLQIDIAEMLKNEPTASAQALRYRILRETLQHVRDILNQDALNTAQLNSLLSKLTEVDLNSSVVTAMITERAIAITMYDLIRIGGGIEEGRSMKKRGIVKPQGNLLERYALTADESFYLEQMDRGLKIAGLPYYKIVSQHPNDLRKPEIPKYALRSALLLPPLKQILIDRDQTIAEISATKIALSLDLYKSTAGSYPKNLAALEKQTNWKLPRDPFNGKSFIYKRTGTGYILYSIGPDLEDNGGKEVEQFRPAIPDIPHELPRPSEVTQEENHNKAGIPPGLPIPRKVTQEEHCDIVWKVNK